MLSDSSVVDSNNLPGIFMTNILRSSDACVSPLRTTDLVRNGGRRTLFRNDQSRRFLDMDMLPTGGTEE